MLYAMNFNTRKLEPIDESGGDKNNLPIGTVLHLNGYSDPDYVITCNMGRNDRFGDYGTIYDCVNLDTGASDRKQAYTLEWIRNKKDNSIQVYITDRVMSDSEMKEALTQANAVKIENDRIAQEKKEAKEKEIKDLPSQYPYLTPDTKYATRNLKLELKRAFPGVKFSVVSPHYGSINITWTDGPLTEDVEKISGKYQKGNFDGMNDIYEWNHDNQFPDVFGGAEYVFENRHESVSLIKKVALEMGYSLESGESDNMGNLPGLDGEQSQMIYRQARQTRA